jgi:hypothetical protein
MSGHISAICRSKPSGPHHEALPRSKLIKCESRVRYALDRLSRSPDSLDNHISSQTSDPQSSYHLFVECIEKI